VGRPGHVVCTAVAMAAALVALGGCGGGDTSDAGSADTSLPHASDTASARSQRSSDPFLEQENPQRFVARWATTEARMENTGKVARYLALSRDCVACRRLAHTVEGYYAAGGFIHGGAWRIDSIRATRSSGGLLTYVIRAHAAPSTVRESSSRPVQQVPGRPVTYQVGLTARGSSFIVSTRTLG
jgi:hypothetical protein